MAVSQIPLYRIYTRNLKIETRVRNSTAILYDHEILCRVSQIKIRVGIYTRIRWHKLETGVDKECA